MIFQRTERAWYSLVEPPISGLLHPTSIAHCAIGNEAKLEVAVALHQPASCELHICSFLDSACISTLIIK